MAAAKTHSETKNLDAIVSQTLMQDFSNSPSITSFTKPIVASIETVSQNNSILKPESGSQRTSLEEPSGSQKLMSDFFLKK